MAAFRTLRSLPQRSLKRRCALPTSLRLFSCRMSHIRAHPCHQSVDEVRLLCAAAAGALAISMVADARSSANCYFETSPQGDVDRLKRWSRVFWNLPAGVSPAFHQSEVNPFLEKHLSRWTAGMASPDTAKTAPKVLVPLCGKTIDMPYLCEVGYGVVGVEGVQRGILDFKAEHQIRVKGLKSKTIWSNDGDGWKEGSTFIPATSFQGARKGFVFKTGDQGLGYYSETPAVWRGKVNLGKRHAPLHILQCDMFDVTPDLLAASTFATDGRFDLIYDRDALGALPPDSWAQYAQRLGSLLRVGGRILLVGVQYDQSKLPYDRKRYNPPPFSVSKEAIQRLFPEPSWSVALLELEPCKDEFVQRCPSIKKENVQVRDVVLLIEKRSEGSGSGPVLKLAVAAGAVALSGLVACGLFRHD